MNGRVPGVLLLLLIVGCAGRSAYDRPYVSDSLSERTGHQLAEAAEPGVPAMPPGADPADGLSSEEAVAIALWNNARFQAEVAGLGFARADLIEAGFLSNPIFSLLFPVGPKGLEAKLYFPVDLLWKQPYRVAAARLDAERAAENLVQNGLGLIREVQTAYAELLAAEGRRDAAREAAGLAEEAAEIIRARQVTGDISEAEASAARVRMREKADQAASAARDARVARLRLVELLGLDPDVPAFELTDPLPVSGQSSPPEDLLEIAFAARPDLRAGELAIEAAGKRLGLARAEIFDLIGIIDAKDKGEETLTTGPGLEVQIPILNQNQAGTTRARAETEQAAYAYVATRHRIAREVQEALADYRLASEQSRLWHGGIIPDLEETWRRVQGAERVGDASRLTVLEVRMQLLEARMRGLEVSADLGRAEAGVNHSVGKKMLPTPASSDETGSGSR